MVSETSMFPSKATSAPPKVSTPESKAPKVSPILAVFETLLIKPPVPPRPNRRAFAPLRISTCSTLYRDL